VRFSSSKYTYRTPGLLAGFQGAASRQKRGKGGEERGKGKGTAFPHFFFYNLTTAQQCTVAATYTGIGKETDFSIRYNVYFFANM